LNLEEIGKFVLKEVEKLGAQGEVYITRSKTLNLTIKNDLLEKLAMSDSQGIGLLVIKDNKAVFTDSTDFTSRGLKELVEKTFSLLPYSKEDEFNKLPSGSSSYPSPLINDPQIQKLPLKKFKNYLNDATKAALSGSSKVKLVQSFFHARPYEIFLLNSKEIELGLEATDLSVSVSATVEEDGERIDGSYYWNSRFFDDLPPPEFVGKEAVKRGLRLLGGKPVKTGVYSVVYENLAASELLWSLFSALSGESINKNRSFLSEYIGKPCFSSLLTVIDDGTIDRKVGSRSFDDEGTATRRKILVDKGKPCLIVDTYRSALRGNREPTGNAWRSYSSRPNVGPTNLFILPGEKSFGEIISKIDKGILITGTLGFGIDIVTGNYSVGAFGIMIEKGELKNPVSGITVGGNLLEMFNSIEEVGNDLIFAARVNSPSILFPQITIGGLE